MNKIRLKSVYSYFVQHIKLPGGREKKSEMSIKIFPLNGSVWFYYTSTLIFLKKLQRLKKKVPLHIKIESKTFLDFN